MSCRLVKKDCFYFRGGKEECFKSHYNSRVLVWHLQVAANEMVQSEDKQVLLYIFSQKYKFCVMTSKRISEN